MSDKLNTAIDMLRKVEERWLQLQARDVSNHDFACLMTDVSNFIWKQDHLLADKRSKL